MAFIAISLDGFDVDRSYRGTQSTCACRSLEEWKLLKELVAAEGTGNWRQKAATLATGRTAKALELKWARHGGVLTPQVRRLFWLRRFRCAYV